MNKPLWVINVFYLHIAGKLNGVIQLSNWHLKESNLHQPIGRIWSIFGILFGSHREYWTKKRPGHNFFCDDRYLASDRYEIGTSNRSTYIFYQLLQLGKRTSCKSYILGAIVKDTGDWVIMADLFQWSNSFSFMTLDDAEEINILEVLHKWIAVKLIFIKRHETAYATHSRNVCKESLNSILQFCKKVVWSQKAAWFYNARIFMCPQHWQLRGGSC